MWLTLFAVGERQCFVAFIFDSLLVDRFIGSGQAQFAFIRVSFVGQCGCVLRAKFW